MKKAALIIFTIVFVAIMAVSLVACSNATVQGQLKDVWRPYEKYTYSVNDGTNTGTYVVEILRSNGGTVEVGTKSVENLGKGILINGKLNIADVEYTTACYVQFNSGGAFNVPKASYKKQTVSGNVTLELVATYADNNYNYSGTQNGTEISGTIALSNPYYDSNEFHQVLRGVNSMSTGFSFSFNVPVAIGESSLASLSASCNSTTKVAYGDDNVECFEVLLSRSTKVNGKDQKLYYTTSPMTIDGWPLPYVLMKFVEPTADGEVVYTLTSVSLTQNSFLF